MGETTYLRVGIDGTGSVTGARVVNRSLDEIYNKAALTDKQVGTLNKSLSNIGTGSSNGIRTVTRDIHNLSSSTTSFRDMLDSIEDRLIRVGISTAVFVALGRTIGAVKDITKETLRYLGQIETSTLGIASSFLVSGKFIDTTTGKALEGQRALTAAQGMSKDVIEQLKVANMQTIATLDQLIVAYQVTLPVAMAKGFNKDQVMDFTLAMVQAAGAIGLPFEQMAEETRSILTGTVNPRTSRIATVLGLRNEDIAQFKGNAKGLFDFLMSRLEGFKIAGLESQKTWAGLWSNFKDISMQGASFAFQGMFDGIKSEVTKLMASIVTIDTVTKKINWNPEFIHNAKSLGNDITSIFKAFVTGSKWIYDNISLITNLLALYLTYKATLLAVSLAQSALNTQTAQAIILAERVATGKASYINSAGSDALRAKQALDLAAATAIETQSQINNMMVTRSNQLEKQKAMASGVAYLQTIEREALANTALAASELEVATARRANLEFQSKSMVTRLANMEPAGSSVTAAQKYEAALARQASLLVQVSAAKEVEQLATTNLTTSTLASEKATNSATLARTRLAEASKALGVTEAEITAAQLSNVASSEALVVATAANDVALSKLTITQRLYAAGATLAAAATTAFDTALNLVGGPIGAAIIAVTSLYWALYKLYNLQDTRNNSLAKISNEGDFAKLVQQEKEANQQIAAIKKQREQEELDKKNVSPAEREKTSVESALAEFDKNRISNLKEEFILKNQIAGLEKTPLLWRDTETGLTKLDVAKQRLANVQTMLTSSARQQVIDTAKAQSALASMNRYVANPPKPEAALDTTGQQKLDTAYAAYIRSLESLEIAGHKAREKASIDSYKTMYNQNLITIQEFYENKKNIEQKGIQLEIDRNNAYIDALKESKVLKTEGTERFGVNHTAEWYDINTKINEAKAKGIDLSEKLKTVGVTAANDITDANKKLADSYSATTAELMKLQGNVKGSELLQLTNSMKDKIAQAETAYGSAPYGSESEIAAKKHLDNLIAEKGIKEELIILADKHRNLQVQADFQSALGNTVAAKAITDQMELEKMKAERMSEGIILMRKATQETQRYVDVLNAQTSAYSKIIGYADKVYELKMKQIDLEARKMKDSGVDNVAIQTWITQETSRNYIERARANDNFNEGVIAGFKELELQQITFGEAGYTITKGIYAQMSSSFSTLFMDVFEGKLKKGVEYIKDFAKSVLKIFLDMIAQMIAQWIMMKTMMAGSKLAGGLLSVFGGSVGNGFGGSAPQPGGTGLDSGGVLSNAPQMHTGGVYGDNLVTTTVNNNVFNNAPKFHSGLKPNEFPAILEKTEGVFTRGQMRAIGRGLELTNAERIMASRAASLQAMKNSAQPIPDRTVVNSNSSAYSDSQIKAQGRAVERQTVNGQGNTNTLQVNIPITGDFASKKMTSELRNEIEATVERVVRRHS